MEDTWTLKYRSWLDSLSEPAPEGVWYSIADTLDIDDAWARISEELDLDEVWRSVEMELPTATVSTGPASSSGRSPKTHWIVASLILLTLFTPISERLKQNPMVDADPGIEDSGGCNQDDAYTGSHTHAFRETIRVATDSLLRVNNVDYEQIETKISEPTQIFVGRKFFQGFPLHSRPISELPIEMNNKSIMLKYKYFIVSSDSGGKSDLGKEPTHMVEATESDSIYEETSRKVKWRLGVIGSIRNTWLINDETTNGLKRSALNKTMVTFGKEFGVTLENSIGKRSFLRAEYYFYAEVVQRYHEYINALYQEKNIRLLYQKLQVAYSWRVLQRASMFSPNILGGVYASKLKVADLTIGSENGNIMREYAPWDYGVLLGIEAEFNLNDKFIIVPGIRTSYGLLNVFEGTSQSPSYFNKTKTAAIGFSVAIKYQN